MSKELKLYIARRCLLMFAFGFLGVATLFNVSSCVRESDWFLAVFYSVTSLFDLLLVLLYSSGIKSALSNHRAGRTLTLTIVRRGDKFGVYSVEREDKDALYGSILSLEKTYESAVEEIFRTKNRAKSLGFKVEWWNVNKA